MDRRAFLRAGVAASASTIAAGAFATTATQEQATPAAIPAATPPPPPSGGKFRMHYGPHLGMFAKHAGKDPVDQLKFIADQGFTAFEDNGMLKRPVEVQNRMAAEMSRSGIIMGVFVANADFNSKTFVKRDPEVRKALVTKMRAAVELAKRVNANWCTVVLDAYDPAVDWGYQTANAIDNLRACAEVCEPSGLIMVLEALNKRDHPGLFHTGMAQGYEICRAVNSPSCKLLMDLYHQQITEGNLIPNADASWDEIAYFQIGDNPGRKEPTTGEINYKNIFRHLHNKGYKGVLGMEHGNSKPGLEGELAVISAYRECDKF